MSASPADPVVSLADSKCSPESAVELRKDSRTGSNMRLHKGNIPSVPQTKSCPLCPAKFTRTTHLSRHLRTHTREKLHECDKCHSQFTRSDLLTRHKRSCSDQGLTRSRRKSCQSCAESKVKCDLQHPCSKCQTRGRDCVYAAGHTVSSSSGYAGPSKGQTDDLETELLAILAAYPEPAQPDGPVPAVPLPRNYWDLMRTSAVLSDKSPSMQQLSSPLATLDTKPSISFSIDSLSTFARIDQTAPQTHGKASDMSDSGMFDDLFGDIFTPTQQMFHPSSDASRLSAKGAAVDNEISGKDSIWDPTFPFPTEPVDVQHDTILVPHETTPSSSGAHSSPGQSDASTPASTTSSLQSSPSAADLQTYLSLFYSAYLPNMPIIHTATFVIEGKSPLLVTAMQACGALYVKTRTAMNFIDTILAKARDELVVELMKESVDWEHRIQLSLAVDLFQTLGLFHHNTEQRAFSNVYHAMLAMMIRLSDFSGKIIDWVPPRVIDQASAPQVWREWAIHETAKRALAVSYLHDCCHCIYFNLRPTYDTSEFDMCLPCEDALWMASSSDEWLSILRQPSPYGSVSERLRGPRLQATYAKFAEPSPAHAPLLVLNPWAHNIVIHMILRQLFEEFLEARLPEIGSQSSLSHPDGNYISEERILALQATMHRWFQSWMISPDSPQYCEEEPRFMDQALPYYWFAKVAIMAYRERQPPFCTGTTFIVSGEAKFRLMKKWERHIRNFLRKGGKEPSLFLDEIVKTRLRKWDGSSPAQDVEEDPVLLLGFFPGT